MRDRLPAVVLTIASIAYASSVAGWTTPQERPSQPPVFRTSTDLAVLDAVVTDSRQQHVTDLAAEDFLISVKGRPVPVRNVVYVRAPSAANPSSDSGETGPRGRDILRSRATRINSVARTIAVVVDDLSLSFESVVRSRRALHTFIDTQRSPDDLVAVLRTSAGIGSLQQFTTDGRLLHAAAERVQLNLFRRNARFDAGVPDLSLDSPGAPAPGGRASHDRGDSRTREEDDTVDGLRSSMVTAGSLGALEFVIRGLASLPGRKSIILVSDGFDLFSRRGNTRVWDRLRGLIESANRAGVVLYAVDARGLETGAATAEDAGPASGSLTSLLHSQDGLRWLAQQTGGIAVVNNNDLNLGFQRILADQRGYYLVGYDAGDGIDSRWEPDRVQVQVRRPGLRVRWRRGLFGPAAGSPTPRTEPDTLRAAIMSPFALSEPEYARTRERGVVYSAMLPLRRTGGYQIRAAVRDVSSGAVGSATQFVNVPRIGRGKIAVSGVLMKGMPGGSNGAEALHHPTVPELLLQAPAIRIFRPDSEAVYAYEIYAGVTERDQLFMSASLLREGRSVYRSSVSAVKYSRSREQIQTVPVGGSLTLGADLPDGLYTLEITVTVRRPRNRELRASQWVEFEVIGGDRQEWASLRGETTKCGASRRAAYSQCGREDRDTGLSSVSGNLRMLQSSAGIDPRPRLGSHSRAQHRQRNTTRLRRGAPDRTRFSVPDAPTTRRTQVDHRRVGCLRKQPKGPLLSAHVRRTASSRA